MASRSFARAASVSLPANSSKPSKAVAAIGSECASRKPVPALAHSFDDHFLAKSVSLSLMARMSSTKALAPHALASKSLSSTGRKSAADCSVSIKKCMQVGLAS